MSGDRAGGATGEYELVVGSLEVGDRHVDDDAFPQYARVARERFIEERIGDALEGYGWPVVHMEMDFHAELFAGDRVHATVEVTDLGTSSFTTEIELARDGEPVATARTVQVTQDVDSGETMPVPDEWRDALTA